MQSVKFTKPWKIWSAGDIAGFEAEQAQRLVDGKVAEKYAAPTRVAAADVGAEQNDAGTESAAAGDPKAKSSRPSK